MAGKKEIPKFEDKYCIKKRSDTISGGTDEQHLAGPDTNYEISTKTCLNIPFSFVDVLEGINKEKKWREAIDLLDDLEEADSYEKIMDKVGVFNWEPLDKLRHHIYNAFLYQMKEDGLSHEKNVPVTVSSLKAIFEISFDYEGGQPIFSKEVECNLPIKWEVEKRVKTGDWKCEITDDPNEQDFESRILNVLEHQYDDFHLYIDDKEHVEYLRSLSFDGFSLSDYL